jgi:hypothetical protein
MHEQHTFQCNLSAAGNGFHDPEALSAPRQQFPPMMMTVSCVSVLKSSVTHPQSLHFSFRIVILYRISVSWFILGLFGHRATCDCRHPPSPPPARSAAKYIKLMASCTGLSSLDAPSRRAEGSCRHQPLKRIICSCPSTSAKSRRHVFCRKFQPADVSEAR